MVGHDGGQICRTWVCRVIVRTAAVLRGDIVDHGKSSKTFLSIGNAQLTAQHRQCSVALYRVACLGVERGGSSASVGCTSRQFGNSRLHHRLVRGVAGVPREQKRLSRLQPCGGDRDDGRDAEQRKVDDSRQGGEAARKVLDLLSSRERR